MSEGHKRKHKEDSSENMSALVSSPKSPKKEHHSHTQSHPHAKYSTLDEVKALLGSGEYRRIDEDYLKQHADLIDTSAVHGAMTFPEGLERYDIYQKGDHQELACIIRIGRKLCGHPDIVHGGVISTLFDNTYGWLFFAVGEKAGFTANLSVNFRRPIYANSTGLMRVVVDKKEGRKTFLKATWEVDGELHADSTALFIKPKPSS